MGEGREAERVVGYAWVLQTSLIESFYAVTVQFKSSGLREVRLKEHGLCISVKISSPYQNKALR